MRPQWFSVCKQCFFSDFGPFSSVLPERTEIRMDGRTDIGTDNVKMIITNDIMTLTWQDSMTTTMKLRQWHGEDDNVTLSMWQWLCDNVNVTMTTLHTEKHKLAFLHTAQRDLQNCCLTCHFQFNAISKRIKLEMRDCAQMKDLFHSFRLVISWTLFYEWQGRQNTKWQSASFF